MFRKLIIAGASKVLTFMGHQAEAQLESGPRRITLKGKRMNFEITGDFEVQIEDQKKKENQP